MIAICSRPEVAYDDISGEDVDTCRDYVEVNLWVFLASGFSRKSKQQFTYVKQQVNLSSIFETKKQNCAMFGKTGLEW